MKFTELTGNIKSDINRYSGFWSENVTLLSRIKTVVAPAVLAVILFRISNFFYENNIKLLARMLWAFNLFLTGAEFQPSSKIGRGFFLGHPVGAIIYGKVGENVTMYAQAAIGGGRGDKDVGAGKGLPVLEDNVVVGARATILGSVIIGEGATIAPCTFVNKDVPAGATAIGNPCRILRSNASEQKNSS
jgi:serine O-acetyltransferase